MWHLRRCLILNNSGKEEVYIGLGSINKGLKTP